MSDLNPRLLALIPTITAGLTNNMRVGPFWVLLNVDFPAANVNTTIAHGLGRKPSGYIITGKRQQGQIHDDGTQAGWTQDAIVLQASVAGNYDLWIL